MQRSDLCADAKTRALWLSEVRSRFAAAPDARRIILQLIRDADDSRDYELFLPSAASPEEETFLLRYVASTVFNILSVFSGRSLCFFCAPETEPLLRQVQELFASGAGLRKVCNIARRIYGGFSFSFRPLAGYQPLDAPAVQTVSDLAERLLRVHAEADERCCIGVDVGGSDIKIAASVCGKLIFLSEYDWNPAACATAEEVISPLLSVVREAKARIEASGHSPNAIGLSFPDVVIDDAVVGGETPKTKGIRENTALDYETEFAKFRALKAGLLALCAPGGRVRIANDGNIAAFTAAMELTAGGRTAEIHSGVLAHSLGTDFGTGWLRSDGTIPAMPLELYDLLLDLGHTEAAALPPEDLRSVRNENSGMPGVRRYLGQSAAYRLAWELDPAMLEGFMRRDDATLLIPTAPEDLRKPCLEHLMALAAGGDPNAEAVFREIGRNLAAVTREFSWLVGKTPETRYIFGRFVKSTRCFSLLREGFAETVSDIRLEAADDALANTALMKQLSASPEYTVAQFGQAVGAIYYALL